MRRPVQPMEIDEIAIRRLPTLQPSWESRTGSKEFSPQCLPPVPTMRGGKYTRFFDQEARNTVRGKRVARDQ